MNYHDFDSYFKKRVYQLSFLNQLELAITISKNLSSDYQIFFETHKWGDPELLMKAISVIEQSKSRLIEPNEFQELLSKIDKIIPDMDDFGDWISSYGLNASISVFESLEFLIDKNPEHVYNIGICFTDTIDFKVKENADLTPEQIDEHPLMIAARNFLIEHTS